MKKKEEKGTLRTLDMNELEQANGGWFVAAARRPGARVVVVGGPRRVFVRGWYC